MLNVSLFDLGERNSPQTRKVKTKLTIHFPNKMYCLPLYLKIGASSFEISGNWQT